jgi:isopenicillin-N epimerase
MQFGHAMREHWALDPEVTYLNHGTVGSPPRRALEAQQQIRDEIERNPSQFLLRELTSITVGSAPLAPPRLRAAADAVAGFVGARGSDFVFTDNVTTSMNAVLRSIELRQGDEIIVTDHTYGGVANAATFATRLHGAVVRTVELPFPGRTAGVTPDTLAPAIVEAIQTALGPRTRLVLMDHITSSSALVLPLAEIAARCRRKGVAVLADGAHVPGAIPLDVPSLGVDWYGANLHKWAWVPRSSGFLWAALERQPALHPTVISWGLDQGFAAEFDLLGTRDPSAHLAAPAAIAFMRELGVEDVQRYNHDLAWEAARLLSQRWGTDLPMVESMVGTMATVPLPPRAGTGKLDAVALRDALLFEERIEVQLHAWRDRLWARVSAQVYNDISDFEKLAKAILARV